MKILIAGLGSIGRRHLKNLIALGEKDIVLYRTGKSTLSDDEFLRDFPVKTEIYEALNCKPDAVIVSNPTSLHMDIAIPAAKAGCYIFLEKPISHSMDRINELKKSLEYHKERLLVGFQFRFNPVFRIAQQLLLNGEIGKVVSVFSHWGEYLPDWHPWENYRNSYSAKAELGGGVVLTLCHPLDYLSWLLGKPILKWSHIRTVSNLVANVEDSADAFLEFPNGALGMVHLDYIQKPPSHTLNITGTQGLIKWDNSNNILSVFRHKTSEWENFSQPEFERNFMFLEMMRHFLDVVKGKAEPFCTLDDGINALELAIKIISFGKINKNIKGAKNV